MEQYKSGSKTCSSEDIEIILEGSIGFLPNGHILLENNDTIKSYGMVCVYSMYTHVISSGLNEIQYITVFCWYIPFRLVMTL